MEGAELWRVPEEAKGTRLDLYLAAHYRMARNRAQVWIRNDRVTVGGRPGKPGLVLVGGEEIACRPMSRVDPSRVVAEEGPLALLHEDDELLAFDKPSGLTVHPGAGRQDGTLVNRLVHRYPEIASVGGSGRPGIVHRLDRDTTGVIVVARTQAAYESLSEAFAERRVDKRYLAVTWGAPTPADGTIERPIGRHPQRRKEMTVVEGGRPAITRYRTVADSGAIAWLDLGLETGRTHQIRVHMKAVGHPLVGDPIYGEARWKSLPPARRKPLKEFPRPALHAWRIGLRHPRSGAPMRFEAPIPADLQRLWLQVTGDDLPTPTG